MQHIDRSRKPNYELAERIISGMCAEGIRFNKEAVLDLMHSHEQREQQMQTRLEELTYEGFNVHSTPSVADLFSDKYDMMHYAVNHRTGKVSFAKEILGKIYLEENIEEALLIMRIRSAHALFKSIQNVLYAMDDKGRVYPEYKFGETNRVYYTQPSLSNLNADSKATLEPDDDCFIYELDYSQQEPYIMAGWWGIEALKVLMRENKDAYTAVARAFLGMDTLTPDMRGNVKTAWLAKSYGAEIPTIAEQVGRDFAKMFYYAIENIPEYRTNKQRIEQELRNGDRTAVSYFGTVRELAGGGGYLKRAKLNNPFQMTGSDILMFAIEDVDNYVTENDIRGKIRLTYTVHDSLLLNVHKDYEGHVQFIKDMLTYQIDDWLPINIEVKRLK